MTALDQREAQLQKEVAAGVQRESQLRVEVAKLQCEVVKLRAEVDRGGQGNRRPQYSGEWSYTHTTQGHTYTQRGHTDYAQSHQFFNNFFN